MQITQLHARFVGEIVTAVRRAEAQLRPRAALALAGSSRELDPVDCKTPRGWVRQIGQ
jgi:hypothetical protein